jgi:hypothetical protein
MEKEKPNPYSKKKIKQTDSYAIYISFIINPTAFFEGILILSAAFTKLTCLQLGHSFKR